jgi:NADH-quinone oxidoreductase subunit J
MIGELVLFSILAAVSVVCAIGMLLQDNPVRCALNLVAVLFCVAVLFLELHASFIAAIQVVVYAGAIMVLFVFVIMLLNLAALEPIKNALKPQNWLATIAGFVLVLTIAAAISAVPASSTLLPKPMTGAFEVGVAMFSPTWLFPFEAISVLLLIAVVGAVILAKRRLS